MPILALVQDPAQDLISGLCEHLYHRNCILDWLSSGHDTCPNCRSAMWDPDVYRTVYESVMANTIVTDASEIC